MRNWFGQARQRRQGQRRHTAYRPLLEQLEGRWLPAPVITTIALQPVTSTPVTAQVPSSQTLLVPVTATSDGGDALTYSASATNGFSAQVLTGETFIQINVANFGTMTLELFNTLTPNTVSAIEGLIKAEFYNGLIFHRVIPGFVIQAGETTSGTSPTSPAIPPEYNNQLIYSGTGELGIANTGPNASNPGNDGFNQFFITLGPQEGLNFNNAIFGQLVSGLSVANAIAAVPRDANDMPLTPVVISSMNVIQDKTDSVLLITGSVRHRLGHGDRHGQRQHQRHVHQSDVQRDHLGDQHLAAVPQPGEQPGSRGRHRLLGHAERQQSQQRGADLSRRAGPSFGNTASDATVTVNQTTGVVTVHPSATFTGPVHVLVGVEQTGATSRGNTPADPNNPLALFSTQQFTVGVGDQALTNVTGTAVNGNEGASTGSQKVASFQDTDPNGAVTDFTASINWGDGNVTSGSITVDNGSGAAKIFTVTGSNTYREAGSFPITVTITDKLGATGKATTTSTITDATLTATGTPFSALAGVAGNFALASFTDADPNGMVSDYSVTITWGDNSTSAGTVVAASGGGFTVMGTHTYAVAGTFNPSVSITDINTAGDVAGATATATTTATVNTQNTGTPNQRFVQQLYRDLLNREADSGGLAYFSNLLNRGVSRNTVVADIETSAEYDAIVLNAAYQKVLNRAPDPLGMLLMLNEIKSGGSELQVEEILMGTQEFFTDTGGTNGGFISTVFQDLLGRAASASDLAFFDHLMTHGASTFQIAQMVGNSAESLGDIVANDFQKFLRRSGTDPIALAALEKNPLLVLPYQTGMLASPEYFNLAQQI